MYSHIQGRVGWNYSSIPEHQRLNNVSKKGPQRCADYAMIAPNITTVSEANFEHFWNSKLFPALCINNYVKKSR